MRAGSEVLGGEGLEREALASTAFFARLGDLLVSSLPLSSLMAISMAARLQNRDVFCVGVSRLSVFRQPRGNVYGLWCLSQPSFFLSSFIFFNPPH